MKEKNINKKIKLESFAQESNLITFISDPENGKCCSGGSSQRKRESVWQTFSLSLFAFNIAVHSDWCRCS
jgi:hypothetical protein